jgi:hypothetical protein
VLGEAGDDEDRLRALFRRCTSAEPSESETDVLAGALDGFRASFEARPGDAASLISVGESMVPEAFAGSEPELAAWTMTASTVMNLYRVTTQE